MRILVIGATGYLGSALFDKLSRNPRNEVIGTGLKNAGCRMGLGKIEQILKMDLENPLEVYKTVADIKPELIVHAGGMTNVGECETEQKKAYRINVAATSDIASASNCKIIYFSSNYVFDGRKGGYFENDIPNSVNYYGFTKKLAEQLVLAGKGNLVLRISSVYGCNPRNNKFLGRFLEKDGKLKEEIPVCRELVVCATYIQDLTVNFEKLMKERGIAHFPGEAVSDYGLVKKLAETMGWNLKLKNLSLKDWCKNGERPRNASLKTLRPEILGLKRTSLEDGLGEMKKQMRRYS